MVAAVSGRIGRSAVAGLAFVAASYHLTDVARRQAESARQQRLARQQQRAHQPSDRKEDPSDQRQILEWIAPDMPDRTGLSVLRLDEAVRHSILGGPGVLPDARLCIDPPLRYTGPAWVLAVAWQPMRCVYFSDRSAHGPPSRV